MKTNRCPNCGARLGAQSNHILQSSVRSPLHNASAALHLPPMNVAQPVALPTMEANVHVPVNQAIITGCLFAPIVILAVSSAARFWVPTGEAILIGGIAGGIALFGMASYQWHTKTEFYDSLLHVVETELGIDLDGDSSIGPPPVVKVEVKSEDGNRWQFADLPGSPDALREFAKYYFMGMGFTDETAQLAGLTQKEMRDLRESFVQKGWAGWKHASRKQQGIEVWHVGKSVLRAIWESSPTLSGAAEA